MTASTLSIYQKHIIVTNIITITDVKLKCLLLPACYFMLFVFLLLENINANHIF